MPKNTNEELQKLESNFKYIGLDLNNIPDFLKETPDLEFRPLKSYEENNFKVYKYVPIKDIQILLTHANRLNSITEKYSLANPIYNYLNPDSEENIIKHATFLNMVKTLNKEEIENIEKEQKELRKKIPFKVKYSDNYLWQIYYSEQTNKYFMLVTTEDLDYNCLFYLLKKQIESCKNKKDETIFVPINCMDYSGKYLRNSETEDIEKYLWLFTKEWPSIYEVYDKTENLSIQIIGNTDVYDKIKSFYKITLNSGKEALKFFKLIKALFILQTELPHYYDFETQISNNGELEFTFNSKILNYDCLSKFLKDEYKQYSNKLKDIFEEKETAEKELAKLKEEVNQKNLEYIFREKQITTYLECKKTVFGRLKYFFKGKNNKFKKVPINKEKTEKNEKILIEQEIALNIIENKEYYTIEDLIKICIEVDRIENKIKNTNLDVKAMKDKIKSLSNKIKNATLYIDEIEKHKKSIFEFWKFANKDEALGLNAGEEKENEDVVKLKKSFNYEEDLESLGVQADKEQRSLFNKEECDSIFAINSESLKNINLLKKDEKNEIDEHILEKLKIESKNEAILFDSDKFDIFGNVKEDKTKIDILANKKHRETKKNKFKILDITPNITLKGYKERLMEILKSVNNSMKKSKALVDMSIYLSETENLNTEEMCIFNINPKNAIEKTEETEKINLFKINIKEGMPIIYYTNIMYYNNYNNTLPLGMNVSDEVLFDMSKFKLELKRQKLFRINQDKNKMEANTKIICAYEYEANPIEMQ